MSHSMESSSSSDQEGPWTPLQSAASFGLYSLPDNNNRDPKHLESNPRYEYLTNDRSTDLHDDDDDVALLGADDTTHRSIPSRDLQLQIREARDCHGNDNDAIQNGRSSGHGCHMISQKMDKTARNQLIIVSVLSFLFMIAEITGGVLSNSLALLTDATHLASDLASFLVSLFALWLATKPPTARMTFGYHRAEVLGALFSIIVIWIMTGVLVYLAVLRIEPIIHPERKQYTIHPDEMLITAGLGVTFNIIMAIVLHSGMFKKCNLPTSLGHNHSHGNHHSHNHSNSDISDEDDSLLDVPSSDSLMDTEILETGCRDDAPSGTRDRNHTYHSNINIKAAVIHVIGDLIQSVGVLVAAVIIKINPDKYKMADPICTFIFSLLVLITTITVLKDVVVIVMEAAPKDVDQAAIRKALSELPGVKSVHCLNIWPLTVHKNAIALHLAVADGAARQDILVAAKHYLRTHHHVIHSTIQIEDYVDEMSTCTDCQNT